MLRTGDIVTGKKDSDLRYYYTNYGAIMRVLEVYTNDTMKVKIEKVSSKAIGALKQAIIKNIGAEFTVEQKYFKRYREEGWD